MMRMCIVSNAVHCITNLLINTEKLVLEFNLQKHDTPALPLQPHSWPLLRDES